MMSSESGGLFSSPRTQRRLLWVSGGVLAIGIAAFVSVYLLRGSSGTPDTFSNKPAKFAPHLTKAPPPPVAFKIARKFVETAVQRQHLDSIYPLVGPAIKGGQSRQTWDKGNIAVMPYHASNAKTASFQVDWSYNKQILFEVDLVAKRGSNTRPHLLFYLGLQKIHGKWLVNYWLPHWMPPVPANPGN